MARESQRTPGARAGTALASVLAWLRFTRRQDSLAAWTCEASMTKAVEAPAWVLKAVPGMCCMAGTWTTFIDVCFTAQASVSWGAAAAEATHQIHTGTIVQAPGIQVQGGAQATVILINLTEHAQRSRRAGAEIAGHEVNAEATMLAGLGGTLVHVILTVVTSVASWTLTHITPHVALAGAPMLAGLGQAGVHLLFTVAACAALRAHTVVRAVLVHTLATCLTQLLHRHPDLGCSLPAGQALDVTEAATPPRGAKAVERGPSPGTATPILTGYTATPVYQRLALSASEALRAGTAEAGMGGGADAPMQAGPREAGVGLMLAVCTSVAGAAQAGEGGHTIHAGPAIEAGAGAAVWKVLLTAEASITRGAGASEGGHVVCAGAWATGTAQTLIYISGAAGTSKAREAGAGKGAHSILTGAAIQAGVGVTVIDVLITGRATIALVASTAETSCQVGAGTMGTTG